VIAERLRDVPLHRGGIGWLLTVRPRSALVDRAACPAGLAVHGPCRNDLMDGDRAAGKHSGAAASAGIAAWPHGRRSNPAVSAEQTGMAASPEGAGRGSARTRTADTSAYRRWRTLNIGRVCSCRAAGRAPAIGRLVPQRVTTTEAAIRVLANQRSVKSIVSDSDRVIFVLPRGGGEVRLLSRAQSPTEARPWLEDRRRLGVRVKRIVLRGAAVARPIVTSSGRPRFVTVRVGRRNSTARAQRPYVSTR